MSIPREMSSDTWLHHGLNGCIKATMGASLYELEIGWVLESMSDTRMFNRKKLAQSYPLHVDSLFGVVA
jgi:hypothetical protein